MGVQNPGVASIAKLLGTPLQGDVVLVEGTNLSIVQVGQQLTLAVTGLLGGHTIQDEGISLAQRTKLNFVGAGVTVSDDLINDQTDVTIPGGGGGGGSATTVEVDLGSTPKWTGTFTITDAAITASSKVLVEQAPGPYTGKGTRADEAELDRIECIAYPGSGVATVRWRAVSGYRILREPKGGAGTGNQNVAARQDVKGLAGSTPNIYPALPTQDPYNDPVLQVVGRVKGNFKFTYQVFT